MKILSIDTACDETSAAVTEGTKILSNVIWSQASLHAKWGGILPSLAQREHEKRIDFVVKKALKSAFPKSLSTSYQLLATKIDAVAVTIGPCLAIAGEVGIIKAKELAKKYTKPLIAVNHIEGHLLSAFAEANSIQRIAYRGEEPITDTLSPIRYPTLGLVISGGHTDLILIKEIGKYELLAQTRDDALGEALDKAARMLGLGYPGGAILEKMAQHGNPNSYLLPLPMSGREKEGFFSYSGLKTAMWKIVEAEKKKGKGLLTKKQIENLAASFQNIAFEHLIRVISSIIRNSSFTIHDLLVGGGVSNNIEVRKRLRKMAKQFGIKVCLPYTKRLCGDNAAMIGVAAYFKAKENKFVKNITRVERLPRSKIGEIFPWEI